MSKGRYSLVYELAVGNVRRFDRRAIDTREAHGSDSFPQTLKRALFNEHARDYKTEEERAEDEDFMEALWREEWRPSFVPDLWFVDADARVVHIFEIEDSSPLTPEKLSQLVDFWWAMDNWEWDVKVVVFDRYGLQPRSIDLQRAAFRQMGADLNSEAYQQAIKFGRFAPDD